MPESTQLSHQLCYSFYHINRLFNQFYTEALAKFDLTYTQYLVLMVLWEKDGQTLQSLGHQLDLASNTLTPLLKRLEDSGWILRLRPDKDKRQLLVQLTDKGRVYQPIILEQLACCFAQMPDLTPAISQNLINAHQDIIAALQSRKNKD